MIKTAVVSLLVLPHFIAYPANKYEKLARINRYRSLGRFIIQNSQQLQLQKSWSIQLTSKSMLGAQKVCEGTQCVDNTVLLLLIRINSKLLIFYFIINYYEVSPPV